MNIINCTDEEFNQYRNNWQQRLIDIHLPEDIHAQIGKIILSQLDEAYAYLRIDYAKIESAKDKADSVIRQYERSKAEGRNEDDRKRNATVYLEHFPIDSTEETINMYDMQRKITARFYSIKGLIDVINNKQQRLITMTGLMKMETELGSGMHM